MKQYQVEFPSVPSPSGGSATGGGLFPLLHVAPDSIFEIRCGFASAQKNIGAAGVTICHGSKWSDWKGTQDVSDVVGLWGDAIQKNPCRTHLRASNIYLTGLVFEWISAPRRTESDWRTKISEVWATLRTIDDFRRFLPLYCWKEVSLSNECVWEYHKTGNPARISI